MSTPNRVLASLRLLHPTVRLSSTSSKFSPPTPGSTKTPPNTPSSQPSSPETAKRKQTMAEADAELKLKLEEMSGDGGEAGLELEDGKPVAMKRGVKNNMFRVI